MNILGINASHRENSNSEIFLEYVLLHLAKKHQTETINLREKNINHCDGCEKCADTNECEIKDDDMSDIYSKMSWADIIIFSTPTYFGMPSGMLKVVMDRTNTLFFEKKLKGKFGAVIVNGTSNPGGIELCAKTCSHYFYDHEMLNVPFYACFTDSGKQTDDRFPTPLSKDIRISLDKLCSEINNILN